MSVPNIVAAVDLMKLSHMVSAHAIHYASVVGGRVHFVCVAEPNIAGLKLPEEIEAGDLIGASRAKTLEYAQRQVEEFAKHHPDMTVPPIEVHIDTGDPAEKIVRAAAAVDADVIFIATHGRTGIKRLILGSVAEKVVRLAGCPVQVCREKKHVVHDD